MTIGDAPMKVQALGTLRRQSACKKDWKACNSGLVCIADVDIRMGFRTKLSNKKGRFYNPLILFDKRSFSGCLAIYVQTTAADATLLKFANVFQNLQKRQYGLFFTLFFSKKNGKFA